MSEQTEKNAASATLQAAGNPGAPATFGRTTVGLVGGMRKYPIYWIGVIVVFVFIGAFGQWLPVKDPGELNISNSFAAPFTNLTHPLGTDQLGRDIFARLVHGAQASLLVALGGVAVTATIGTSLGIIAGYFGNAPDAIIMRFVDIVLALPGILAALPIIAAFGPSLQNLILVLALIGWGQYARLIRSETLSIRERDYVVSAQVIGCSSTRILVRHVFPNVINSLIVLVSFSFGTIIIFESGISFLGLGIQPPSISWGLMLAESRTYVTSAWWLMAPGLAITLTVLSFNMVGDWLRVRLDPTQSRNH
jgi:peptide/nickel transport system permease protein